MPAPLHREQRGCNVANTPASPRRRVARVHWQELVPGGIGAETHQALRNLLRAAQAAGASADSFLKVNVYLRDNDAERFAEMNAAYKRFWDETSPHTPARITVGCGGLALNANVELDAVVSGGGPTSRL